MTEPFQPELLEMNFIDNTDYPVRISKEHDELLKQNLNFIKLEYCYSEHKEAIRKLSYFDDIFYCENIPQSFTKEITHKINLTDENPVAT